jgi:hypothetical protein
MPVKTITVGKFRKRVRSIRMSDVVLDLIDRLVKARAAEPARAVRR